MEVKKKLTYLMYDGRLHKIGESVNPEQRLKQLKTANPFCELICCGSGVSEKYLHNLFFQKRRSLEWFELSNENLEKIKRLILKGDTEKGRYNSKRKVIHQSVEINGVKFISKKLGSSYTLSDKNIKENVDAKKRSIELNKKYVIKFGKYNGTRIINMVSDEQFQYCQWYFNKTFSDIRKNQKTKDRQYKAFSWWIKIGYKQYKEKTINYDTEAEKIVFVYKDSDFIESEYIIDFGKYSGNKIIDMTSDEQVEYCQWIHRSMQLQKEKFSKKFRAFDWWINQLENNLKN